MNQTEPRRERTRLSRERIIEAAFRAWGGRHFTNTSLNLVARELAVTKPAVYRYFKGKEELLEALRHDYADRLDAELVAPLEAREEEYRDMPVGTAALERAARVYVEGVFSFFERNPYHYAFFVRYLLGRPFERRPEFRDTVRRHDELLMRHLPSPRVLRYVASTAAFWTTEHYRRDVPTGNPVQGVLFEPENLMLHETRRTSVIESISRRLMYGFLPADHRLVDLELVERTAWLTPEEIPVSDRVFSAIEEVVQEQGYAAATVERIAERVGITKSSLYHYFQNRDEMLMQVVQRDQQHFASLARIRLQQIEHPEQQLYAFFVMIASYMAQHSVSMTVENWIRENDVTVELPQEHIEQVQAVFTFLTEMVLSGRLTANAGEAFSVIGYVRFLIVQELYLLDQPISREECISLARTLFALFSRGLTTTVEEPEGSESREKKEVTL